MSKFSQCVSFEMCHKVISADTWEGLIPKELKHHRRSKYPGGKTHTCYSFRLFEENPDDNNNARIAGVDNFAHGNFAERITFISCDGLKDLTTKNLRIRNKNPSD